MARYSVFETATATYTYEGSIGEGGCGIVFRVRDEDGQLFALKLLTKANKDKRKRFKNELKFCQRNEHLNIVKVIDHGIVFEGETSLPFYVMPLYQSPLRALMKSGLASTDILKIFSDVLDGVEAAHLLGVFHRDLKPENLLVESPSLRVAVADFGIAHFEEEHLVTSVETNPGDRLANHLYCAPEQRTKETAVDRRADIFALGLILNEMFTREVPLGTGHRLIASADPDFAYLDPIVEKMIRRNPVDRYGSIEEIKNELSIRGNAFVTQQRLDRVRKIVVPAAMPDDPLGGVDVVATGFGYDDDNLTFRLEPRPPSIWVQTLKQSRYHASATGYTGVNLDQEIIRIPLSPNLVVEGCDKVRQWVESTNRDYRKKLADEARAEERRLRSELDERESKLARQAMALALLQQARLK